jgi:hypothetical protein
MATPSVRPSASEASPRPTATPDAAPSPAAIELPEPGRPFEASTLLTEMRVTSRPGGVPDELTTLAVATELARALWTFDGSGWDTMAVSGFCGSERCTLEIAGTRFGDLGEDLWIFAIRPATAELSVTAAELRSLPPDLVDALDKLTREVADFATLDGMLLTTARWLPPPLEHRFVLSYRTGGEEGSCARDLTLDAVRGTLVEESSTGC